jgi:hypothetical protein
MRHPTGGLASKQEEKRKSEGGDMDQAMEDGMATMENSQVPVAHRERVAETLRKRYGIDSEFVRVAALSKVLGIAQPTIYSQMRSGTFFLPYRRLSSMPAVKFDDLVDWYCANQVVEARPDVLHRLKGEPSLEEMRAKVYSDALVASALAKMNRSRGTRGPR